MSDNPTLVIDKLVTEESVTRAYYEYRIMRYLLEHPGADQAKAYKYARVAWARKRKKRPLKGVGNV